MGEKDVHLHDASKTLSLPHPLVPQSKRSILLFSRFDTYLYPQQIENKIISAALRTKMMVNCD